MSAECPSHSEPLNQSDSQNQTKLNNMPNLLNETIKLVVCDLDGTLLNENHALTEHTKQAVKSCVAQGYEFMVATGRHYEDVYLIAEQLQVEVSLITSNGARVHNHHGECLYENHMPRHLVEQVLKLSRGFKVHRNVYLGDLWLVEEPHEALLAIHDASGFRYQITEFATHDLGLVDKIYFTAEHTLLLQLEASLQQQLGEQLNITFTSPEYLEVMNLGVNKGQALQMLMRQKQIKASEVMAFGDGMNDVEMLNLVGVGVVMDNASQRVKSRLADLPIAPSNANSGVAKFLQKYLL